MKQTETEALPPKRRHCLRQWRNHWPRRPRNAGGGEGVDAWAYMGAQNYGINFFHWQFNTAIFVRTCVAM